MNSPVDLPAFHQAVSSCREGPKVKVLLLGLLPPLTLSSTGGS